MPSSPLLDLASFDDLDPFSSQSSHQPRVRGPNTLGGEFEPDYSELDAEEREQRQQAQSRAEPVETFWPREPAVQKELANRRMDQARRSATLFRARRLVRTGHGLEEPERYFPTGIQVVDDLMAGGLQRGELVELVGWRTSGRFSLALSLVAGATQMGESAALVDLGDHLDPQAALLAGVELERLLWLRPHTVKQALGCAELLIGAGFPLIVVDLGQPPLRGGRGNEAAWLRLQRGAQDHCCALLVTSPYRASGTAAHAVLELQGARGAWLGHGVEPRLLGGLNCGAELAKSRLPRLRQDDRAVAQDHQQRHPAHHFDLVFATGSVVEPVEALPQREPRKRRVPRASAANDSRPVESRLGTTTTSERWIEPVPVLRKVG